MLSEATTLREAQESVHRVRRQWPLFPNQDDGEMRLGIKQIEADGVVDEAHRALRRARPDGPVCGRKGEVDTAERRLRAA